MVNEGSKNRETTELQLLTAVDELVKEKGFEGLGINAIASKAGFSKMLIYRYFNSLEGLIAAYIQKHDYWINFNEELPDKEHLGDFIKELFKKEIKALREDYTLRHLYRWELTNNNKFVRELREKREEKGLLLLNQLGNINGYSQKEVAAIATLISASISYLVLLEENCQVYNGIPLQEEKGWEQLQHGINLMIDLCLLKDKK
ncbi:TetR/AcrR family transcriptional regulator [uncultured Bacteroides sp.]|uniref:TetR/AcrR family transcriptional regulator n=1 Tax=uncultured Bacteroides sp. TaxID=162156 RepID=UPI002AAB92E9|nr:TetR/AcrR family transcriptional regulator [uncultured Bacteroides sp.]